MSRKIVQTLVLLLLLVGFPLVSWIYLSDGLSFRLDAIEALQPKSALPTPGDSLHQKGQILILYDTAHPEALKVARVKEHFSDRGDVVFLNFPSEMEVLQDSLEKVMKLTGVGETWRESIFLIGQLGMIRRNYLLSSDSQMGDLTEHIAFLIPPDPERDFDFRREVEK